MYMCVNIYIHVNVYVYIYNPVCDACPQVPAAHDIPLVFNVTFLPRAPNPAPNATLKSKASAEPVMALAVR